MRILVVGAGATGGYFGGRFLEAGRDVSFLVRPRRAAKLAATGLHIQSPQGDVHIPRPPTVLAENLTEPYDLVLLSCKAFDLPGAISAFAPAVGEHTSILPILNGLRHIDILRQRFGETVLGGRCLITSTLDEQGRIIHFAPGHTITFGELDGVTSPRVQAIEKQFDGVNSKGDLSSRILHDMWEKWVFLATAAGSTCLMRGSVGDICASREGRDFVVALLAESQAIAEANGFPTRPEWLDRSRDMLTTSGSPLTASMLRDLEAGGPIEADHVIGDMLARSPYPSPLLRTVYAGLKTYEARRDRTRPVL